MKEILDIRYGSWENAFFDLYLPDENCTDLVIWFHGGGLENGHRTGSVFASQLTDAGVGLASVEYRMYAPGGQPNGVKFPDFLEDSAQSVAYILDRLPQFGNPSKVWISGQSAGAWITMMLAMNPRYLDRAGVDRSRISGYISDSAQVTTHFNVLRERGLDTRLERIDEAAPLYYLTESCPVDHLLMIWYDQDMPCRPQQNLLMLTALKRFFPERDIQGVQLTGTHCSGSSRKNDRGTFDYGDELLKFINR